jgi:hypothetical protein
MKDLLLLNQSLLHHLHQKLKRNLMSQRKRKPTSHMHHTLWLLLKHQEIKLCQLLLSQLLLLPLPNQPLLQPNQLLLQPNQPLLQPNLL